MEQRQRVGLEAGHRKGGVVATAGGAFATYSLVDRGPKFADVLAVADGAAATLVIGKVVE